MPEIPQPTTRTSIFSIESGDNEAIESGDAGDVDMASIFSIESSDNFEVASSGNEDGGRSDFSSLGVSFSVYLA